MKRLIIAVALLLAASNAHAWSDLSQMNGTYPYPGGNWACQDSSPGYANVASDSTTPDPSTVLKLTYPAGFYNGNYAAKCWNMQPNGSTEMWAQYWFKYSAGYNFHPIDNKQFYFFTGDENSVNNWYISVNGSHQVNVITQTFATDRHLPNTGYDPYISDGQWYKLKARFVMGTPGGMNGTLQVWVNDSLVINKTNVGYISQSEGIREAQIAPVYGGNTGISKPSEDYQYYDLVYIGSTDPGGSSAGDTQPPYVSSTDPPEGSTGRDNTVRTVSVTVADAGGGLVVRSTVSMQTNVNGGSWSTWSYGSGLTFSPNTSTFSSGTITRTMGSDWPAGATIGVRINATDNNGNVMPQEAYTFQTAFAGTGATKTKAEVLAYITALPNQPTKKLLSGQRIGFVNSSGDDDGIIDFTRAATASGGKYPAIMAIDLGDYDGLRTYNLTAVIDHWNAGGLVSAVVNWSDPANGNVWEWPMNDPMFTLSQAYTPGNSTYDNFRINLVAVGDALTTLQNAGVVVMLTPFHEMNDDNNPPTFWWAGGGSGHSPAQYISLWQYVHDYLTTTRGLNNLIWVFGATRYYDPTPYYPGSSYVDIVGFSYYSETDRFNASNAISTYNTLLGYGKPFVMSELGQCSQGQFGGSYCEGRDSRTIVNDLSSYFPNAASWYNWDDEWQLGYQNYVSSLFNDSRVITREDNPSGALTGTSITITTSTLPAGVVGSGYSQQLTLTAVGGMSPYTWSKSSGTLPGGITISTSGVVSGIPTAAGTFSFTVQAVDANSVSDTQDLTITVAPLLPGGQTTVTGVAFTDTYTNSGAASTNYGTATTMTAYQWPSATVANRIILVNSSDISALPDNISITSAKVRLYATGYEGSGGTNPMRVHSKSISGTLPDPATVTWNTFAGTLSADLSVTDVTLVSGWFEWDVTSYVAAQYANSKAAVYFALDGGSDGASDTNRIFASVNNATTQNRPQLVIVFTQMVGTEGPSISAPGKLRVTRAIMKSFR